MSVSEQKLAQAAAWHEAGRLSDAEAIYLEFLRHQPGDVRVLAMLGLLRQQQGQVDEAVRLLRQAYGLAPERLDLALHLAAVEVASGSFARAKPLYQKILASDPSSRDALAGLTHVLGELGEYESALDQCERLIQHYPDLLPAREAQARLHLGAGHWDAAEATARNLLGDNPGCVDPQLVLAEIAMLRGNNERASELIERLLADQPELASAWTVKARIHQARGELSAALDAVNRSLAIEAGQEQATALQISVYQALAQLEEARQLAEQAVASNPGSAAMHYALARVLQDLGEMQDSEAAFRKSLSLGSTAEPEILECLVRFQRYQPDSDDENHIRSLLQAKSVDGQGPVQAALRPG